MNDGGRAAHQEYREAGLSYASRSEDAAARASAAGEWRDGWPVICAGVIGLILSTIHLGPLTVLMKPLGQVFGWSRSQISAGQMIITLFIFVLTPAVGLAIPRFGIRAIVLVSTLIFSVGLAMLGFCTANVWSWYLGWIVMGFGYVGLSPLLWTTAVIRTFSRNRGLALALTLSGTGISAFASPLVTVYALETFSWRAPFFILAGFCLFVALPALWWLMRLRPVFDAPPATGDATGPARMQDRSRSGRREVLADPRVWQLVLASTLIAASVGMLMTHLQAIMRDFGATATQAAAYFSALGPSLIVGRLGAGVLLDRLPPRIVAAALFLLPAITCVLLLGYDGSAVQGVVCCIVFGLSYGAETDVLAYLTARYFDPRAYPVVYSLVYSMFGLGYGVAGVLGGAIFDQFGSYERMLYGLIASVLVGALLVLTLAGPKAARAT